MTKGRGLLHLLDEVDATEKHEEEAKALLRSSEETAAKRREAAKTDRNSLFLPPGPMLASPRPVLQRANSVRVCVCFGSHH